MTPLQAFYNCWVDMYFLPQDKSTNYLKEKITPNKLLHRHPNFTQIFKIKGEVFFKEKMAS